MSYKATVTLRQLEASKYTFVQGDSNIADMLECIGLPADLREDITGMVVIIASGEIDSVWLSESGTPYDLSAWYHPLPYYRPEKWNVDYLPFYWLESNSDYNEVQ